MLQNKQNKIVRASVQKHSLDRPVPRYNEVNWRMPLVTPRQLYVLSTSRLLWLLWLKRLSREAKLTTMSSYIFTRFVSYYPFSVSSQFNDMHLQEDMAALNRIKTLETELLDLERSTSASGLFTKFSLLTC